MSLKAADWNKIYNEITSEGTIITPEAEIIFFVASEQIFIFGTASRSIIPVISSKACSFSFILFLELSFFLSKISDIKNCRTGTSTAPCFR